MRVEADGGQLGVARELNIEPIGASISQCTARYHHHATPIPFLTSTIGAGLTTLERLEFFPLS